MPLAAKNATMNQHRPIHFLHRGQPVSVDGLSPLRTVLDWLREDVRCTGTKEGCGEGDCGACTVIVAELAERVAATEAPGTAATVVGGVSLRPVNACIRFLPTLDGKALLTVEDLAALAAPAALHPAQQAMVDCHGSQCGFCTPGFVMTLAHSHACHTAAGTVPTRQQLADELAGNLCRCTGYRPILDAGEQMFKRPAATFDTSALAAQLRALQADPPLTYAAPNPAAGGRVDHFFAPRTLDDFAALREARPQARLLAGTTDVGLWVNKQFRDLGDVLYIGAVDELRRITVADGELIIGAAAPLEDAWSALAVHWPALGEVWRRFAGPPVRHAGTLGGNIANGSPIGDSAPILMALDARLLLRRGSRQRSLPLDAFYVAYMKNRLEPGEFVESIAVPLPRAPQRFRAYKISKRYDCDISALCAGLRIDVEAGVVSAARFSYGGMAAVVQRAALAEAAVLGRPWDAATLQAAMTALDHDFTPLTDLRASSSYRQQTARNLLKRLWLETRDTDPLAAAETTVWARVA
jgi:xanthine dehydrogenase small subunit